MAFACGSDRCSLYTIRKRRQGFGQASGLIGEHGYLNSVCWTSPCKKFRMMSAGLHVLYSKCHSTR